VSLAIYEGYKDILDHGSEVHMVLDLITAKPWLAVVRDVKSHPIHSDVGSAAFSLAFGEVHHSPS
jgi:hypothetical protein